jgi:hypothetical protein
VAASSWIACAVALGVASALVAGSAAAQDTRQIGIQLTVIHASKTPGPIDPEAARLHKRLKKDFRYESLRVVQRRKMRMPMRGMRKLDLPTGRTLRVRALELDQKGLLMAVEVQDRLDTRLLLKSRKPVVIGGEDYKGGKLFIEIESDY